MDLTAAWTAAWSERGSRPAFLAGDRVEAFAALAAWREDCGLGLTAGGVEPGAVVSFPAGFSARSIAALFALATARAIAVPLGRGLSPAARAERENAARAGWRLDWEEEGSFSLTRLAPDASRHRLYRKLDRLGHPGLVLFTSGTSGAPKAVLHDLQALLEGYQVRDSSRPRRVMPLMLPDHVGGLDMVLRAVAGGGTLVVPADLSPQEIQRAAARHRPEVLAAPPSLLNLLLLAGVLQGGAFDHVGLVAHGAEPMPDSLLARLRAALPGAEFQERFGTTETGALRLGAGGSEGGGWRLDDPSVRWKVKDGELWVRTPGRALGYLNADAGGRFAAGGWYRTGDAAEVTAEGGFRLLGRRADVINVGGEKVFPARVEAVLLGHPDVLECCVRGVPNAVLGQAVGVDIVWRAAGATPAQVKRDLLGFVGDRLPAWARPVHVRLVQAIARTPTGKVRRGMRASGPEGRRMTAYRKSEG